MTRYEIALKRPPEEIIEEPNIDITWKDLKGVDALKVPPLVSGSTGCGPSPFNKNKAVEEILAAKKHGLTKQVALEYIALQIRVHHHYYEKCYKQWEEFLDEVFDEVKLEGALEL